MEIEGVIGRKEGSLKQGWVYLGYERKIMLIEEILME